MARHAFFSNYVLRNVPMRTAVTVMAMLIFFKYVFTCPCTTREITLLHCWLYLCLPIGILFFIMILIDAQLLKMCRCYVCKCCVSGQSRCCKSECCDTFECCCCAGGYCYHPERCGQEGWYYCGIIWKHLFNVFYAGSLWIVVAFIDGDWYVCMRTVNVNGTGEQIACKDLPTPGEAETLRKFDSESRVKFIYIHYLCYLFYCYPSYLITNFGSQANAPRTLTSGFWLHMSGEIKNDFFAFCSS